MLNGPRHFLSLFLNSLILDKNVVSPNPSERTKLAVIVAVVTVFRDTDSFIGLFLLQRQLHFHVHNEQGLYFRRAPARIIGK